MLDKKDQNITKGHIQPAISKPSKIQSKVLQDSKEKQEPNNNDVKITNLSEPDIPFPAGQISLSTIKPRQSYSINHKPYPQEKEKTSKRHDSTYGNEEQLSLKLYASGDFTSANRGDNFSLINEHSSPIYVPAKKLSLFIKPTPLDKEEIIKFPKNLSQLDASPLGESQIVESPLERSYASNDMRAPHAVFQKKYMPPTLNLQTKTFNNSRMNSGASSPFKQESIPKNLSEAEIEMYQEDKKFDFSSHHLYMDDVQKYPIEQISELELAEEGGMK